MFQCNWTATHRLGTNNIIFCISNILLVAQLLYNELEVTHRLTPSHTQNDVTISFIDHISVVCGSIGTFFTVLPMIIWQGRHFWRLRIKNGRYRWGYLILYDFRMFLAELLWSKLTLIFHIIIAKHIYFSINKLTLNKNKWDKKALWAVFISVYFLFYIRLSNCFITTYKNTLILNFFKTFQCFIYI